ncbi:methyltransferase domain-containing protein [Hymenobacter chitinivorans]|uniref:Ubiquinone/menaquinone biosynthesis C-methylase UbiE n=1 Tax=Hymenobacter chitinivorans DSM 11115 TaxID=1121954 RepID=A0A2M9B5U6_9BACT|nr:methyltransferase domain-containing protein [Hymenobacter chitinivorans]PJJ53308.1 ubiquinone/menaquinone biosynthesis C-methylase UbiE [Hymenobacter chitinivorans DSM 11115]
MPDLSTRATEEELMDDLTLASDALRQNLDELETINTWLGGYRVVLSGLQRLRPRFPAGRALHLADLGSGGGDTLRHIAGWARRRRVSVELVGIDANAFMIDYAASKAAAFPEISFQQQDIFSAGFRQQQFDIITCSLFCHHFSSEALAVLLRQLRAQARVGVIINDLHRHPLAYYSIKWLTRLFGGSHLVQNDAPLSVARAFTRREWQQILAEAGIERYSLRWCWAFRWQVIF